MLTVDESVPSSEIGYVERGGCVLLNFEMVGFRSTRAADRSLIRDIIVAT